MEPTAGAGPTMWSKVVTGHWLPASVIIVLECDGLFANFCMMPSVVGPGPATCLPPRALNSSDRSLAVTRLPPDTRLSPSLPLHSLKCRQNSDCYHFANIQRQTGTRRGFHNQHIEGLHWFEGWFSIFRSFYSHTRKLWFLLWSDVV